MRLGEIELSAIPARIDREEDIALLHELTRLEVHGVEVTGNTGAQLDGLERVDAAGDLLVLGHELLLDGGDGDLGRGHRATAALSVQHSRSDKAQVAREEQ
jgi:hypothetical protein